MGRAKWVLGRHSSTVLMDTSSRMGGAPPAPSPPASSLLSLLFLSPGAQGPDVYRPPFSYLWISHIWKRTGGDFFHCENQFCHRSCPSTFSNSQSVGCFNLKGHRLSWTTLTPPTEEPFKDLRAKSSSDTAQAQACLFPVLRASSYFLLQVLTNRELSSLSV